MSTSNREIENRTEIPLEAGLPLNVARRIAKFSLERHECHDCLTTSWRTNYYHIEYFAMNPEYELEFDLCEKCYEECKETGLLDDYLVVVTKYE